MYKTVIYIILLIFLSLPIIQFQFNLIDLKPLGGSFTLHEKKDFSIKNWFSAEFQENYDKYLEDHIGFRSFFIRGYNQLFYSLFNVAKSPGCVVGRNNQLFLRSYIDGYLGSNFKGEDKINEELKKLKHIQDLFAKREKLLLLVFAPGKASFYPEFIPEEYNLNAKNENNYEYYIKKCTELNINFIDLNSYFLKIKNSSKYPLYPQNGVHWTSYGMYLGIDSIVKYIEKKQNINIRDFNPESITMSDSVVHPDKDVEETMNLMFDINKPDVPHISFNFSDQPNSFKPKVLAISDSYYWQVYGANIPHNIFNWGGFWFYFKTIYPERNGITTSVDSVNIKTELLNQDVVILMGTEATLHLFPYDFDVKAYEQFLPRDNESLIKYYSEKIKSDKNWYNSIIDKAIKNNITISSQLRIDAEFMTNQNLSESNADERKLQEIIKRITNDEAWFENVKKKAIENNISLDEMLRKDAEWVFQNEK